MSTRFFQPTSDVRVRPGRQPIWELDEAWTCEMDSTPTDGGAFARAFALAAPADDVDELFDFSDS